MNYLLKISGAGNRFLIADKRCFGKGVPKHWQKHSLKTNKNFKEFLELSLQSQQQREVFIKSLIKGGDLLLTDGLVVLHPTRGQKASPDTSSQTSHQKSSVSALNPLTTKPESSPDTLNPQTSHPESSVSDSISQTAQPDLICDFYNKDGSVAEMCGNASVAVAFYSADRGQALSLFKLGAKLVKAIKNSKGEWAVSLNSRPIIKGEFIFDFKGQSYNYNLISAGVPHAVLKLPVSENFFHTVKTQFKDLAQSLRFKNPLKGANVSFYCVTSTQKLQAITFERGVEGFTLACGTGALAVTLAHLKHSSVKNIQNYFVSMPGGTLKILFDKKSQPFLFSPIKKGY